MMKLAKKSDYEIRSCKHGQTQCATPIARDERKTTELRPRNIEDNQVFDYSSASK